MTHGSVALMCAIAAVALSLLQYLVLPDYQALVRVATLVLMILAVSSWLTGRLIEWAARAPHGAP